MATFARPFRATAVGAVLALVALGTAACSGSTTNGNGSLDPGAASSPINPTPSEPTGPSGSGESTTGFPSSPATAPPSSVDPGACPTDAYCDSFGDSSSGWQTDNKPHFFIGYDQFLGGTYRMGERSAATVPSVAPFEVTKISNDYSVQVDVDAVLAESMPASTSFGILCWQHVAKDGQNDSAFIFLVNQSQASIGLWDEEDGNYRAITSKSTQGLVKTGGAANHLSVACVQGTVNGSAQAQLAITLNGTEIVTATYDKSVQTYAWGVGEHVGLLASGQGSDIFYDNFVVTSKCDGEFC